MNQDLTGNQAEDFQPHTRNPQAIPNTNLQPNGGLSQGGLQDILTGNPNARILVPGGSSNPQTKAATTTESSGSSGLIWVIVLFAAIAVIAVVLWIRRRSHERITQS